MPDGRRVQVLAWPQGYPIEMDSDVADLLPVPVLAESDDHHAVEFTAVSRLIITSSTELDELALDALLLQCGCATDAGLQRGGK
jgi:hypothetical protein